MKINIQPQDKRGPVSKSYLLHPDLHERLAQYADSIDSEVNYVLGLILDQTLPALKTTKKEKSEKPVKLQEIA